MNVKIGFFPILFLIFLTLKLMGEIAWSWWWVTAPLWGPFAVAGAILASAGLYLLAAGTVRTIRRRVWPL